MHILGGSGHGDAIEVVTAGNEHELCCSDNIFELKSKVDTIILLFITYKISMDASITMPYLCRL